MNDQNPTGINNHPHPFTLEPLDDVPTAPPLSAREVSELRRLQEESISARRHVAHRKEGNRGDVTVRKARDNAQYVRQQKGHSWILEWVVLGIFTVWIRPIYLAFSPNHYFHL